LAEALRDASAAAGRGKLGHGLGNDTAQTRGHCR